MPMKSNVNVISSILKLFMSMIQKNMVAVLIRECVYLLLPLDRREDYCYRELVSRRCVTTSDTIRTTQASCCCSSGKAWGRRCETCPSEGTGK